MRSALTSAKIFGNLKTDIKSQTATFTVPAKVNFKEKLDEIASRNKHVKDYEVKK